MRAERLAEKYAVEFDAWAYDLRPGIPPEGLPREEASKGRTYPPGYVDNMIATARDAGIDMKRPPLIPNTRKAHEATEYAKEHGKLLDFHRAVFKAYFEDEENIGDTEVLARIARDAGLDEAGLREALADGRYDAAVAEQMEWARQAGITGVPTTIVNDRFAIVGAQDYELYRDVARRTLQRAEG